jgi:hypothetical protein
MGLPVAPSAFASGGAGAPRGHKANGLRTSSPAVGGRRPVVTVTTANQGAAAVAGNTAVLITSLHKPPTGYNLTAAHVLRIASANPKVRAELGRYPKAKSYTYTKGSGYWQVSWFASPHSSKEVIQVYISDGTGKVTQIWTGFQVPWTMARGYPGAFGRRVNALYVWLPMCLLFMAPFLPSTYSCSWGSRSPWPCSTTPRSGCRSRSCTPS